MMYNKIECPTCGNVTTAKLTRELQKCKWCRRLFSVDVTKHKGKFIWNADVADFSEQMSCY